MTKLNFLLSLHEKLSDLPQKEVEERLNFYSEAIEDRMEEGFSEEDAVSAVGTVDEIVAQIIADISTATKESKTKGHHKAWVIVLLALGAPLWLSLLIATFAVILSLFVSLWSVVISLWAVFTSAIACTLACIVLGIGLMVNGKTLSGFGSVSAGIVCTGVTILLFFGCKAATNGAVFLTKKFAKSIQKYFKRKENA